MQRKNRFSGWCHRNESAEGRHAYGLVDKIEEMNHQLVAISKAAAGDRGLVAGDMTMTGRQLAPMGDMGFEELIDIYKEQAGYLVDAGVDLFVVETMMSLNECRAALIAIREVTDLPAITRSIKGFIMALPGIPTGLFTI